MAGQLQLRRGTTIENDALVGAPGEVTVDTTLHQLRLHDGETQGGFVVGNGSGATLLDWKFTDHQLSDISWLRADTFSWQSGSVYQLAYQHLVEDYNEVEEHSQTETIAGITIEYYQAVDGHKIVLADQENNVESIYNATGVAWYYILDVEHHKFKLPRTKHNVVGLRDTAGKYVAAGLPNITGTFAAAQAQNASGAFSVGTQHTTTYNEGSARPITNINFSATSSNAVFGASQTVQPPATQMYLYFFVGNFRRDEQYNPAIDDVLEFIYPLDSLYFGTQQVCPLEVLMPGSVWELLPGDKALWTGAGANAGTTIEAGLPNITGRASSAGEDSSRLGPNGTEGAFYCDQQGHVGSGTSGAATYTITLGLDASRSNPIYGNSTTVQPPAYVINVWRRIA